MHSLASLLELQEQKQQVAQLVELKVYSSFLRKAKALKQEVKLYFANNRN
jgi:hypothetical protein